MSPWTDRVESVPNGGIRLHHCGDQSFVPMTRANRPTACAGVPAHGTENLKPPIWMRALTLGTAEPQKTFDFLSPLHPRDCVLSLWDQMRSRSALTVEAPRSRRIDLAWSPLTITTNATIDPSSAWPTA